MKIIICGAGSWGSALAHLLSEHHEVGLWNHSKENLLAIEKNGENKKYLPGISLKKVTIYKDLKKALAEVEMIVIAIPTLFLRSFLQKAKTHVHKDQIVVSVVKGLEFKTNLLVTDIITSQWKMIEKIAVLSGPSHAEEVGRHKPTAVVVACECLETAHIIQRIFMTSYFRVYINRDLRGVELGGAIKNVIAIAAGITYGLDLGANSLAALMTRGLVEMKKLGKAMGGKSKTFYGLAGLGDLIATCESKYSRNRRVGKYLSKGFSWDSIQKKMNQVAEGVPTAKAIHQFSLDHNLEMPICNEIYQILFENKKSKDALLTLMTRKAQME